MTREEILRMSASEVEARANELAKESETATADRLDEISVELEAIVERKKVLEIQKRAAEAVAKGAGQPIGQPTPKVETLRPAEDAVLLDNTGFTVEQSVAAVMQILEEKLGDRL